MATFEDVRTIYERLYEDLREATGENAPSSCTFLGRTLPEVDEDLGRCNLRITGRRHDDPLGIDRCVGTGEPVAWVFEVVQGTLAAIGEDATPEEIAAELRGDMGLNDSPEVWGGIYKELRQASDI